MIVIIPLLALLQVFVISQISFWSALPLVWLVFLVSFMDELPAHELVRWGAVYAVVVSTFSSTNPLWYMIAILISTVLAIAWTRFAMSLRALRKAFAVRRLVAAAIFLTSYVLIIAASVAGNTNIGRTGIVLTFSILVNYALIWAVNRSHGKLRVQE